MVESTFYFHSYSEWREAITQRCRIDLTPDYVRSRIAALQDPSEPTTREFIATYGESYLRQVVQWFEQAEQA